MFLRPICLLSGNRDLVELVEGLGGVLRHVLRSPSISDCAEIVVDVADNPSLFPCLPLCSLGAALIRLPSTLGKDPAVSSSGLDQKDVGFGFVQRYYTRNKSIPRIVVS